MRKVAMIVAMVWALALSSAPTPALAAPGWFSFTANANGTKAGFKYLRSIPDGSALAVGWTPGDRVAYRCAYAFLEVGDQLVGRVTLTNIEYSRLNDKYMKEGVRYYDGAIYTGTHQQVRDCPHPSESYADVDGPIGPTPVVVFSDDNGSILEVRDFSTVVQVGSGPPWEFQIVSATRDRVSIVGYQSGEPTLAIYYDRLSPSISLTSNLTNGLAIPPSTSAG